QTAQVGPMPPDEPLVFNHDRKGLSVSFSHQMNRAIKQYRRWHWNFAGCLPCQRRPRPDDDQFIGLGRSRKRVQRRQCLSLIADEPCRSIRAGHLQAQSRPPFLEVRAHGTIAKTAADAGKIAMDWAISLRISHTPDYPLA